MEEWADGLRHIRNTIYKIRLRFCWKATAIIVNRWDTPAFCHRAEEGRSLHCHLRIKVGSPRHTTSGVYTDYILLYGSHKAFQVCGSREIEFWFETTWQFVCLSVFIVFFKFNCTLCMWTWLLRIWRHLGELACLLQDMYSGLQESESQQEKQWTIYLS